MSGKYIQTSSIRYIYSVNRGESLMGRRSPRLLNLEWLCSNTLKPLCLQGTLHFFIKIVQLFRNLLVFRLNPNFWKVLSHQRTWPPNMESWFSYPNPAILRICAPRKLLKDVPERCKEWAKLKKILLIEGCLGWQRWARKEEVPVTAAWWSMNWRVRSFAVMRLVHARSWWTFQSKRGARKLSSLSFKFFSFLFSFSFLSSLFLVHSFTFAFKIEIY